MIFGPVRNIGLAQLIYGNCRTKVGTTKDKIFEGALHIRGAYFHAFQTNDQIGDTCVGPQKL